MELAKIGRASNADYAIDRIATNLNFKPQNLYMSPRSQQME